MKGLVLLMSLLLITGCNLLDQDHEHSEKIHTHSATTDQHSHAEQTHAHTGHAEDSADTTIAITHFSDTTELFVEFPALLIDQESPFLAHLTRLDNFKPIASGTVTVVLIGGGVPDELFTIETPITAGIFRPLIVPKHPVKRQVILNLKGEDIAANHDLGEFMVYSSKEEALAAMPEETEPEDAIAYLKEQQWQVDFATSGVVDRMLRASIEATGTLRPRADGEVYLSASSTGHIRSQGKFPYPGMQVESGQVLASIIPRLAVDTDVSTLRANLDKAHANYALAKHERERLEQLWNDKVIALHRLHEAKSAMEVAKAELDAAQRRYEQSTGEEPIASTGIAILAPISGVLAQVHVAPGQYVGEGETLFHIVNVDRLWLEARIAEADIGRLENPDGAWFSVEGFTQTFNTFDLAGRTVGLGGAVDPVSRTTPLIFEFDNPDHRLRTGMFANARVFTGETRSGLAVPVSAVFDDAGQEVIYVLLDGESFQRRLVRLGIREGDWIQVISGVQLGERVVSRGAYLLRLASTSPTQAGHGHAH